MSKEDELEFNSYVPPKYTYKIRYKDKMYVFDKLSECCKFLNSLDVLDKPINTNKLLKTVLTRLKFQILFVVMFDGRSCLTKFANTVERRFI